MNYKFLVPLLFSLLLFVPIAYAEKGVGIVAYTQSETVNESQTNCVTFGVYNPFTESTTLYMTASGALAPLVADSQPITVPAGTMHDKAIPVSLCFNIPKVYEESCTAGIVCSKDCSEQQVTYVGEVIASAAKSELSAGSAGSATQAAASVPLTLKVACAQTGKNWTPIIAIVVMLAILAGLVVLRKRKR